MKIKEYYKTISITGLQYYDALQCINKLKVGKKLRVEIEPDNIHDENAIEVYCGKKKIGYIPKRNNYTMSKFLDIGYSPFELRVVSIGPKENPLSELLVNVYLVNNTEKESKKSNIKAYYDRIDSENEVLKAHGLNK